MWLYDPWIILIALWLGWWLDHRLGEPRFWHPLVGYGRLVSWLERGLNPEAVSVMASRFQQRLLGVIALVLALVPLVAGLALLLACTDTSDGAEAGMASVLLNLLLQALALYFALGARSLHQHLEQIERPLRAGDLEQARFYVGWIVSRDTADMTPMRVTRAAIESGLENGSDGAFAPVFWFVLLGAPGVLLYRLANTLDAMWGYKTSRLLHFGWAAARFDDLLNLIPARITALLYAVNSPAGWTGVKSALSCWRHQGRYWESPNAGPVMAAGAGALQLQLGGGDTYHGVWKERPPLGMGREPEADDLPVARRFLSRVMVSWLLLASVVLILSQLAA